MTLLSSSDFAGLCLALLCLSGLILSFHAFGAQLHRMEENTPHKFALKPESTSCVLKSVSHQRYDMGTLPTPPPAEGSAAEMRLSVVVDFLTYCLLQGSADR